MCYNMVQSMPKLNSWSGKAGTTKPTMMRMTLPMTLGFKNIRDTTHWKTSVANTSIKKGIRLTTRTHDPSEDWNLNLRCPWLCFSAVLPTANSWDIGRPPVWFGKSTETLDTPWSQPRAEGYSGCETANDSGVTLWMICWENPVVLWGKPMVAGWTW